MKALVHFLDGCKFSQVIDLKQRPWQDLFKLVSGFKRYKPHIAYLRCLLRNVDLLISAY